MDAVVATMRLGNRKANPSRSASSLPLYPACVNRQHRIAHMEPPQSGHSAGSFRRWPWRSGIQTNVRPATPVAVIFSAIPFQDFIFIFSASGVVLPRRRGFAALEMQESAMKLVFGIAIMFLGIAAAQGQTASQPNGQTASGGSTAASDPLSVPTSTLPSGSSSSSAAGSGSAGGASGGISSQAPVLLPGEMSASGTSQSSQQLPGETPATSTQSARTTASAPAASSPTCVSVPSTDGGSANLTEMVGGSLDGC
jgi:hypothetical protein